MQIMFFTFRQNNSGGYFIVNDNVAVNLIIEAVNAEDAVDKMSEITENYSEYCDCCGERWSSWWVNDEDGTDKPMIWGEEVNKESGSVVIYYVDGRKEKVNY